MEQIANTKETTMESIVGHMSRVVIDMQNAHKNIIGSLDRLDGKSTVPSTSDAKVPMKQESPPSIIGKLDDILGAMHSLRDRMQDSAERINGIV